MHSIPPAERHDTPRRQGAPTERSPHKPMTSHPAFEWRPCDRHPWLGVSVLVTPLDARCILPDGSAHPVELEQAA